MRLAADAMAEGLWPGEALVRQSVSEQLADVLGLGASVRRRSRLTPATWRQLLLALLVRLRAKQLRATDDRWTPQRLLLLYRLLQKAMGGKMDRLSEELIAPRGGLQGPRKACTEVVRVDLGLGKDLKATRLGRSALQHYVERELAWLELSDLELCYPSRLPERLARAFAQGLA